MSDFTPASPEASALSNGELMLNAALRSGAPVVAYLGQSAGWGANCSDPVLSLALKKVSRSGDNWRDLLSREALPGDFFEWLGERFLNRAPPQEILTIADTPFSAIYTSSIDPGLINLFSTQGRQPEPVLIGDPTPPVLRSRRRVPVYYLFGRAGAGPGDFTPPSTNQALSQRRLRHASAMLKTINEAATPLGLIVVDGYGPAQDWLKGEDLLAVLGTAPKGGVLWCGAEPEFLDDDAENFDALKDQGVIVRDRRSLGQILALLRTTGEEWQPGWDEPGIITLADGKKLVTTARLRLSTQASAAIVDDGWLGFLPSLSGDTERTSFAAFHAVPAGPLSLIEGLRRGFAISREFEQLLQKRVSKAVARHHEENGAIILHGQSGIGKTIALGRLALALRENHSAAVLFAYNRGLQAADVSDFLSEVDKLNGVSVVVVDFSSSYQRYDDLLEAFRSRGHRVVVVGSSYKVEAQYQIGRSRFIEAPAALSSTEKDDLAKLAERFGVGERSRFAVIASQPHALARFFWELPSSRTRLSEGLGREARDTEATLRQRGATKRPHKAISNLGLALIEAGYDHPAVPLLADEETIEPPTTTAAGRVIDYVMAASRLYKPVPMNLLLRAVITAGVGGTTNDNVELIRELFEGQDIFRWRFADEEGEELLVGARLQIEAELICNRRLGGATGEAERLIELIGNAVRAGPEDNEETRFLVDLVYALGPDAPFKERYRDSYAAIARALTNLRQRHGVRNARLMLQEATLRRHFVRTHPLQPDQKAAILDEAREVVDEALAAIQQSSGRQLYASKRTRDNLWVERAATYGFLATDSAQQGSNLGVVWSSYKAAREAVRAATGRVDTYFPLDIGLWVPANILRVSQHLGSSERLELEADIRSTLDLVDPEFLDPTQAEIFQRQRFRVGEVLGDTPLTEEAFDALSAAGSTVGYYLRARALAPTTPERGETANSADRAAARTAAGYLWTVYDSISADTRCLLLLLSCEWLAMTGRWLFRGQRQSLPFSTEDRLKLRHILLDLLSSAPNAVQARYRYLEAVLNWLTTDEAGARESFRALAYETEYVERGRVISRHVIADEADQPIVFDGVVERKISDKRWSVYVERLSRRVDLVESDRDQSSIEVGRTIRDFTIAFNYLGPIVDTRPRALHRQ